MTSIQSVSLLQSLVERPIGEEMDREIFERLGGGRLIENTRQLVESAASERVSWIRENLRTAMQSAGLDPNTIYALTGVAPATVRGFLAQTGTSITNVVMMGLALGLTLADLDCSPEEFSKRLEMVRE